jgi:hypothetical protein
MAVARRKPGKVPDLRQHTFLTPDGWVTETYMRLDRDDHKRLGEIAGELEHLPAEVRRHFDQDGRDARFLRILAERAGSGS